MKNTVQLIQKQIVKEYFFQFIVYAPLVGLSWSLMLLFENNFFDAFFIGFTIGLTLTFFILFIGFIIMEIVIKGGQIKFLKSKLFDDLKEMEFFLNEDLFFEGKYKKYFIKVYIQEKPVSNFKKEKHYIIESYYYYPQKLKAKERLQLDANNSDNCSGGIYFGNHIVSLILKNDKQPNLKESIDYLVFTLDRLELSPIEESEVEQEILNPRKEKEKTEIESRTKKIIKLGKLDIKYIKQKK